MAEDALTHQSVMFGSPLQGPWVSSNDKSDKLFVRMVSIETCHVSKVCTEQHACWHKPCQTGCHTNYCTAPFLPSLTDGPRTDSKLHSLHAAPHHVPVR